MWFYQHIKTVVPWALWGMADRQSSFPRSMDRRIKSLTKGEGNWGSGQDIV